jgi:hypothetical protein
MKHNITQTENYLLIVDDSEIKAGDWFYNNVLKECVKVIGVWGDKVDSLNSNLETFKVAAHLPLNNSPILEGVDLLPKIEDDIEEWAWDNPCLSRKDVYTLFKEVFKEQRLDGQFSISAAKQVYEFNSKLRDLAKEKAKVIKEKYKCTEDDLIKAIDMARLQGNEPFLVKYTEDEIIQSFQQPKMPIAFECEVKTEFGFMDLSGKTPYEKVGQTVWVGKYIFND